MIDTPPRTPAQEAFEAGVKAGFYRDPDLTPENETETTRFAMAVVEKVVAMHCGVSVSAFGVSSPGIEAYGAINLATGELGDPRDLLPNRMRHRDWALGFRTACRFGWFEGVYVDPEGVGGSGRRGHVAAVSDAGLAACLLTAHQYRAHADRILEVGAVWGATMQRLRHDIEGLCRLMIEASDLHREAWHNAQAIHKCAPGLPGGAEEALRVRSALHARASEMARRQLSETVEMVRQAEGFLAQAVGDVAVPAVAPARMGVR